MNLSNESEHEPAESREVLARRLIIVSEELGRLHTEAARLRGDLKLLNEEYSEVRRRLFACHATPGDRATVTVGAGGGESVRLEWRDGVPFAVTRVG